MELDNDARALVGECIRRGRYLQSHETEAAESIFYLNLYWIIAAPPPNPEFRIRTFCLADYSQSPRIEMGRIAIWLNEELLQFGTGQM